MNKYPMFTADALNPDANPLAFSHNGTITSWVEMNVKNPLDLAYLNANQLGNTDRAVVVGNPTDGWTLVSWKGTAVSATPTLGMAFFVTFRDYGFVVERSAWNDRRLRAGSPSSRYRTHPGPCRNCGAARSACP